MSAARLYIKEFQNGAYAVHEEPIEGAVPYDCSVDAKSSGGTKSPTWDALAMALAGVRAVAKRDGCTECSVAHDTADRALKAAGYPADGPWRTESGTPVRRAGAAWNGPAKTDPAAPADATFGTARMDFEDWWGRAGRHLDVAAPIYERKGLAAAAFAAAAAQSQNYVADSEVEPTRVDFANGRFVEVVGREACLEVGIGPLAVGVCAAPIIQEGVTTWFGVSKTPDCLTCMDRGRVWDGEDGETKPCPACATWGVWLEPTSPTVAGQPGWENEEPWTRARADRVSGAYNNGNRLWRAEVRLLPTDTLETGAPP